MDSTAEMKASPAASCTLPNSSSVLLALACLTPPSPILIPSQIFTSYTSGDILILLDAPIVDPLACPESSGGLIQEAISQSFSTGTIGTFGVRCRSAQDSSSRSGSRISTSRHSISSVADSTFSLPLDSSGGYDDSSPHFMMLSSVSSDSDTPLVPRSSNVSPICQLQSSALTDPIQSDNTNIYDDSYKQILQYITPSQPLPALPTPSFSPPPPDPSVSIIMSRPDGPRFRRTFGLGPERSPHGNYHDPEQSEARPSDPHSAHCPPMTPIFDQPTRRADASFTVELVRPSFEYSNPAALTLDPRFSFLPENLCWLQGINVELLIDQEGFRSIQPSFKLAGYSSQSRCLRDNTAMDPGVAQFMPVKRQAFVFHYAPFDSPPVLRRLTVNGDESHDYISRQASLSIKSKGVYTVRGTETSSINSASSRGSDVMKISWQFDYMVSDRRVESTCKFIDGERTFTPLTFSCSPALLHSVQGKKVRLMHVVRKSVVPKLVAEKMEPPKLPTTVPVPPLNVMEAITCSFEGIHKRAHSYVHRRSGNEEHAGKLPARVGLDSNTRLAKSGVRDSSAIVVGPTRRRRASSAGEQSRVPSSNDLLFRRIENSDPEPSAKPMPDCLPLSKNILPRSHLCALLSADMENQAPVAPRDHLGFQALTPRTYRPPLGMTRNLREREGE